MTTLVHAHLELKEEDVKRTWMNVTQVRVSTVESVLIELVLLSVNANLGTLGQDAREISTSVWLIRAHRKARQTVYS